MPGPVGSGAVEHRPFVEAEAACRAGARGRRFDHLARVTEARPATGQYGVRIDDQAGAAVDRLASIVAPLCPRAVVRVLEDDPGPRVPPPDRPDAGSVIGEEEIDNRVRGTPLASVEVVVGQFVDGGAVATLPLPPEPFGNQYGGGGQECVRSRGSAHVRLFFLGRWTRDCEGRRVLSRGAG